MKKEKVKEISKMVFKNQFNEMEETDRVLFRNDYCQRAGMALPTFYHKVNSGNFKPLEEELFNSMITAYKAKSHAQLS